MDRLLYEIALRSQHKARTLEFEAKQLGDTLDGLRNENMELKRLQRSQAREIHERHDFVDMANLSLKGFRRDVRFSEESCVGAQVLQRYWFTGSLSAITGNAETVFKCRAQKSGQDKQALMVTVPPFIMHLHAIVFILEP